MQHAMDDAALEAWMNLRGRRHAAMSHDHDRYLPFIHQGEWTMMGPAGDGFTTRVMVMFAHDMMARNTRLGTMVMNQGQVIKRLQDEVDQMRVQQGLPKIYDVLPPQLLP